MIKDLEKEIEGIKIQFAEDVRTILSKKDFIPVKDKYISRKKGLITELMKRLQVISGEERPLAGKLINTCKSEIENNIQKSIDAFEDENDDGEDNDDD